MCKNIILCCPQEKIPKKKLGWIIIKYSFFTVNYKLIERLACFFYCILAIESELNGVVLVGDDEKKLLQIDDVFLLIYILRQDETYWDAFLNHIYETGGFK